MTAEPIPLNLSVPADRPEQAHELRRDYVAQIRAALDVLSARLLALLAVIGGIGIWSWAVYSPSLWPFIIGCGYSVGVIFPTVWLYKAEG